VILRRSYIRQPSGFLPPRGRLKESDGQLGLVSLVFVAQEARTKQKTDRQDAQLLLRLLLEDRFPRIWLPNGGESRSAKARQIALVIRWRQRCVPEGDIGDRNWPRQYPYHAHTYRSWLDAVETSIAVQQKLMRHADTRTTMNVYGDIVTDEMDQAHSKVVRLALAPVN
jgi:integrase